MLRRPIESKVERSLPDQSGRVSLGGRTVRLIDTTLMVTTSVKSFAGH